MVVVERSSAEMAMQINTEAKDVPETRKSRVNKKLREIKCHCADCLSQVLPGHQGKKWEVDVRSIER